MPLLLQGFKNGNGLIQLPRGLLKADTTETMDDVRWRKTSWPKGCLRILWNACRSRSEFPSVAVNSQSFRGWPCWAKIPGFEDRCCHLDGNCSVCIPPQSVHSPSLVQSLLDQQPVISSLVPAQLHLGGVGFPQNPDQSRYSDFSSLKLGCKQRYALLYIFLRYT